MKDEQKNQPRIAKRSRFSESGYNTHGFPVTRLLHLMHIDLDILLVELRVGLSKILVVLVPSFSSFPHLLQSNRQIGSSWSTGLAQTISLLVVNVIVVESYSRGRGMRRNGNLESLESGRKSVSSWLRTRDCDDQVSERHLDSESVKVGRPRSAPPTEQGKKEEYGALDEICDRMESHVDERVGQRHQPDNHDIAAWTQKVSLAGRRTRGRATELTHRDPNQVSIEFDKRSISFKTLID